METVMNDKQPEALFYADTLEKVFGLDEYAVEMRRLYEENERIKQVLHLTGLQLTETEVGVRLTNRAGMQLMQVGDAEWMRGQE
jgi:translation initiation factor IF-3